MTIPTSSMPNEIWHEDFTVPVTGMPDISLIEEVLRSTDPLADPSQPWLITIKWHDTDVVLPLTPLHIAEGPTGPVVTCRYSTDVALLRPGQQPQQQIYDDAALVHGELKLYQKDEDTWMLRVVYEEHLGM